MSNTVYLNENYSEKSIALFGNTKPYSTEIAKIGGKFNPSLKTGSSEDDSTRGPGWVFSKGKKAIVQELVSQINSGVVKPSESSSGTKKSKSNSTSSVNTDDFITKQAFMALVSRVERLEQELRHILDGHKTPSGAKGSEAVSKTPSGASAQKSSNLKEEKQQIVFDSEDEDDEETRPIPRLLKGRK